MKLNKNGLFLILMDITSWIAIGGIITSAFVTYHLAIRKGDLAKYDLHFSPSRSTGATDKKYFYEKGKKVPIIGIVNLIKLKQNNCKRIVHHIYLAL